MWLDYKRNPHNYILQLLKNAYIFYVKRKYTWHSFFIYFVLLIIYPLNSSLLFLITAV